LIVYRFAGFSRNFPSHAPTFFHLPAAVSVTTRGKLQRISPVAAGAKKGRKTRGNPSADAIFLCEN